MPEDRSHTEGEATFKSADQAGGLSEQEPQLSDDIQMLRDALGRTITNATTERAEDPNYQESAGNIRSDNVRKAKDRREKADELGRNYLSWAEDEDTLAEHRGYVDRNQRLDAVIRAAGSMREALTSASLEELRARYQDQLERAQRGETVRNDTPTGNNLADQVVSIQEARIRLNMVDWSEDAVAAMHTAETRTA